MKGRLSSHRLLLWLLGASTLLWVAGCAATVPAIPVDGHLASDRLRTTVDSEYARYYVEDFPEPDLRHEHLHRLLVRLESLPTDRETLRMIASRYSPDLAALLFAHGVLREGRNQRARERFDEHLARVLRRGEGAMSEAPATRRDPLLLFAPGWFYEEAPENGGDFARQRRFLKRRGVETELLRTGENASVEANAELIARRLGELRDEGREVVLVSASKSGPEVALALGATVPPAEADHVLGWINIGGVLQGSPLADEALRPPVRWALGPLLGWECDGIASLTTTERRRISPDLSVPEHVLVLNYVPVPMSGDITSRAEGLYQSLRRYGPNDGLTLLADSIHPGGVTLTALGLDHFLLDPAIDARTLALYETVLDLLGT